MALEDEELTGPILGAAIAVHRALGPGFLESLYAAALSVEMKEREIWLEREVSVPVVYRDVVIGTHRVDLLVVRHGLILNFAKPTLEAKRVLGPAIPAFMPSSAAGSRSRIPGHS